jgi:hypothetical protein
MELENVILSQVNQAQKAKGHMFSLTQIIDLKNSAILWVTLRGSHAWEG